MTVYAMQGPATSQPAYDPETSYWETQPWRPDAQDLVLLLKCKGHPYPHGSIVVGQGINPDFAWTAFSCCDFGSVNEIATGVTDISLEDAKRHVEVNLV